MTYNFRAEFLGDEEYLPAESLTDYVTPILGSVSLSADVPVRAEQGQTVNIALTLLDKENQLATKNTTAEITIVPPSGETNNITATIENGTSTIQYTPTVEGVYNISMVTLANDFYAASNTFTRTMRTGKIPTHFDFNVSNLRPTVGTQIIASGVLSDVDENPIPAGITLPGTLFNNASVTTNQNGEFSKSITPSTAGNYTVKAAYGGNNDYQSSESTQKTVNVQKATPSIQVINPTVNRGETLFIALYNSIPNLPSVGGKKLTLTYTGGNLTNPRTYTRYTDSNGVADIQINYAPGTYNLEISFAGDEIYNTVTKTVSMVVRNYQNTGEKQGAPNNYNISGAPYKLWDIGGATQNSVQCGSSSNPIASSAGTYNTPNPILFNWFHFNIPSDATIISAKVLWSDKASTGMVFGAPKVQLVNTGYGNSNIVSAPSGATSTNTSQSVTFSSVNISPDSANNDNFGVVFRYGKNTSGNIGTLTMSYVRMIIEYVTPQSRPTGPVGV